MKDMWNSRFAEKEYIYGKEPNQFFKSHMDVFQPGSKVLFAAEGEGRNAVFALINGLNAVACDFSEEAKKKALQLAEENLVQLEYYVGDLIDIDFPEESFDGLVLIYAHFPPQNRSKIHQKLQSLLKPGGKLILEGFSKNHLEVSKNNERSSGPRNIEMLFTTDIIKSDFNEMKFLLETEEIVELEESQYHEGKSSIIRMLGAKNG